MAGESMIDKQFTDSLNEVFALYDNHELYGKYL
jgi:hypothetical protein